ncbi:MAG: hypothetical protein LBS44_04740 [Deltaproteobacteria bacterium]|nr:hypothetical protein [Deltaproteobacteria bacterium]
MKAMLYGLVALLTICSPAFGAEEITKWDILVMSEADVRIALPGEQESRLVPPDMTPEEISKTELLDLHDLELYDFPDWFSKFTNLRKLDISGTKIPIGAISKLNNLDKLEVLDVSRNESFLVTYKDPNNKDHDNSVASVRFDECNTFISKISGIRTLNMQNIWYTWTKSSFEENYVSPMCSFSSLKKLIKLYLSDNDLVDKDFNNLNLNGLIELKILDLSKNGLKKINLTSLPSLENLNLSRNYLYEINLNSLPNLKILNVSFNWLKFDFIYQLPISLEELFLNGNHYFFEQDIKKEPYKEINLPNLWFLSIEDSIYDYCYKKDKRDSFPFVGDFPSLEVLLLGNNTYYDSDSGCKVSLTLDKKYGDIFYLKKLRELSCDEAATIPKTLIERANKRKKAFKEMNKNTSSNDEN